MPKNTHIPLKVVKIPLDRTIRTSFKKDFPRMSRLYLELIENTKKISPEHLGKEFTPKYTNNPPPRESTPEKNNIYNDESDDDAMSIRSDDSIKDFDDDRERDIMADSEDEDEDDELTKKLKSLLDDDETSSAGDLTPRSSHNHRSGRSKRRTPPTLNQLKQTGAYKAPNIVQELGGDGDDEDDEDRKRELLFKFDLLKKSYKGSHVPEFSIHSDYKTMERTYDHTVKKLSMESTVENYKTYLIGGFMVTEYIFGSWFKFDMQGFTQQQILSMSSYEKLLIELGERSYVPEGSSWPVEVRLLFLIIINAAFFIISKLILRKTGSNLMNMVNSMNTANAPAARTGVKRKMKGPSINLDEIP
jgi:hypothetical protein